MGGCLRRILMVVCAVMFLIAGGKLLSIYSEYHAGEAAYSDSVQDFVTDVTDRTNISHPVGPGSSTQTEENVQADGSLPIPPIQVDFDGLKAVNPDVIGWIYCEDTSINYPVLQGADNDAYLHRLYDGTYNSAGSIFVDCHNQRGFADANTIIYGHHMRNGTMFAGLQKFADQAYYEAHPIMWLLTPEQTYQVILFSGYTTSASSDTYTIFDLPGDKLDAYISACISQSDFTADVSLEGAEKFVVLSTCAYSFEDARYVVHGALLPVEVPAA